MPEILDADENLRVLTRLVAHFEQHVEDPSYLDPEVGARLAPGTVGIRLPITRFVCKVKMSQDKDPQRSGRCSRSCAAPARTQQPALADDMERALRVDDVRARPRRATSTTRPTASGYAVPAARSADRRAPARGARRRERRCVNVGAGAGSYEPDDRYVVAVEASQAMRAGSSGCVPTSPRARGTRATATCVASPSSSARCDWSWPPDLR